MAGTGFKAQVSNVATGTSAKTIVQIVAASNHGILIEEIRISFEGNTSTAVPPLVELVTQTDAGTMTSLTLVKDPPDSDETLQTTAQHTATVEPTTTDIREAQYVRADGGVWAWRWPLHRRLKVPGGTRLGVRVTAAATVDCSVTVVGEE